LIALDSSVVVAAFASWHRLHNEAREVVAGARLPAHAAVEAYSVLTRLPAPHRAAPDVARDYLRQFPEPWLALDAGALRDLLVRLPGLGVSGGPTYDALIAETAVRAGAELVSCDQRARAVYARCGATVRVLGRS
jgi:predicted nucleic acid-binding protein